MLATAPTIARTELPEVTVAVLNDGQADRTFIPLSVIESEVQALLNREFSIKFPTDKQVHGNWKIDQIREVLGRLERDPEIDVIMTTGLIATQVAADQPSLAKPVIGIAVADSVLQKFPRHGDTSGKTNFVYLADDHTVGQDLDLFHRLIGFEHLVVIPDRLVLDALPELPKLIGQAEERLNANIGVVNAGTSAAAILEALPDNTDAVYMPPLLRFNPEQIAALVAGLNQRRIPTFALTGQPYMSAGVLMTGSGRNVDLTRAGRRIALNLQAILLGTDAGDLKVEIAQPQKLAINMVTARQIGYSPRWRDLEGAVIIDTPDENPPGVRSLVDALELALAANPELSVSRFNPLLAATDVDRARAGLLPQLSLSAGATHIDSDRANPIAQAERSGDVSMSARQLVYSERVWAGFDIAKNLKLAEDHALRVVALNVLEQTAVAYLELLRAKAQADVRRSNVKVTESNLELAIAREKIGQSGRADVLRFKSELAIDRQNFYAAQAEIDAAMVELKRLLSLGIDDPIEGNDGGIARLLDLLAADRYQHLFDNELRWNLFRRFHIERALSQAPELDQLDAQIEGAARNVLLTKRIYYVPEVNLVGQAAGRVLRGGTGSSLRGTGLDDAEWSFGVQAELPLFAGGERRAARAEAEYSLDQTRDVRAQVSTNVEARVTAALERAGGAYPAIRLSQSAAVAARDNLSLVTDSYSAGAASITELNDAQDAALTAELAAAQARYQFIINFVRVLRGVGSFDILLLPGGLEEWYAQLSEYFVSAGVATR